MSDMATILLAEDEPTTHELVKDKLCDRGFDVVSAHDGLEALARLGEREFDLVLSDIFMPGTNGDEVLRLAKEIAPDTEVVITTGMVEKIIPSEWIASGAYDLIKKPYKIVDLLATVERALERRQLRAASALYEASRAILDTREPSLLPEVVVSTAYKAMAADDVVLMLAGDDDQLYEACSTALTESVRRETRAALVTLLDEMEPTISSSGNVQSCIVYPLRTTERLLGVLAISRIVNTRPFRKLDLEKAAVLGSQVMLALENLRIARHTIAAERSSSVGQVATSIAHEINNPISYVLASQGHLRDKLVHVDRLCTMIVKGASNEELRAELARAGGDAFAADLLQTADDVRDGAERVRDILRDTRLLALNDDRPISFDVNEALRSALRVVAAEIRHKAVIHTKLGDGLIVLGSVGQIAQVFVNLLVNAAEAFCDGAKNTIDIESKSVGNHVVINVRDNGPGIAPEHLPRVFDSFNTTKTGPTAGLGLPISRDIVRGHGGEMFVESHLGRGATFSIVLPMVARPRSIPPTAPPVSEKAVTSARLRLMFVDDEPNILRSYGRLFSAAHDVVLAEDGQSALAALRENPDFDLIVCDLSMPTMSGMRFHAEVAALAPSLLPRIVFATGGSTQRDIEQFLATITNLVLEKPFDMRVLRRLVAGLQRVS